MPNKIPNDIRQEVYERAGFACELTGRRRGLTIHHIVPRRHRNHRKEALILLSPYMHEAVERERGKNSLHQQLKIGLQMIYTDKYDEDKARELMGGRLYEGKVTNASIRSHFHKVRRGL